MSNRNILKERAIVNARPEKKQFVTEIEDVVVFKLIKTLYAIENKWIKEIVRVKTIAPIPGLPEFVPGLLNIRGEICSAVNIQIFLEHREIGISDINSAVIISGNGVEYALLADSINGFDSSESFKSDSFPENFNSLQREFIKGISPNGTLLLDGDALTQNRKIIIEQ